VPYEIAMRMSPRRRTAFCIVFGQLTGGDWDWGAMAWREKRA
jgi:hypothetical protein